MSDDPFLAKLKRDAEAERSQPDTTGPEVELAPVSAAAPEPGTPPHPEAPPPGEAMQARQGRTSRPEQARTRSTYRDRRALAFWQSSVAAAFIQRRITGSETLTAAGYFTQLVDSSLRGGAAISLRGKSPVLECELLHEGACGSMTFLDSSAERLDYARVRVPDDLKGAVEFAAGEPADHDPAGPISLVVCDSVLHRVANPGAVIERLAGWLAPEGLVYVHEFVGPNQFQWSDAQLEIVNRLLASLPEGLRVDLASEAGEVKTAISRPDEARFIRDHPTEAVSSAEIRGALDEHLEPVVVKPYGGAIFHQLFARIMGNFVRRPELVEMLLEFDAILTDCEVVESDYLWAAYRRRR